MITGTEAEAVWSAVGKFGAFIAVLVAIITGIKYLYQLMPSSKLEARIKDVEDHSKSDFERLKNIEHRLNTLEERIDKTGNEIQKIDEGIQRIGKSQISMLRHFANGNGKEVMNKEADDLTEFFIER